ncbi:MtN3-like protein [Phytophthora cinnamomi]|nr:MtN3-like protein [Phytophthora cinnamomi]
MLYGYLTENYFPLLSCFLYGECCAVIYLSVYLYYSTEKPYVLRVLAAVLTIVAIVTIYAIIGSLGYTRQTTSSVNTVMGLIADCGGFCLYGAPMEILFQVIKHKSAVFMNVHMVIAGLASNICWFTYGFLVTNWFIMSLNVFFVIVNVLTLCLYRIYDPRTHPLQDGHNGFPGNADNEQISVCIQPTPRLELNTPQITLESLPSPVYAYFSSP